MSLVNQVLNDLEKNQVNEQKLSLEAVQKNRLPLTYILITALLIILAAAWFWFNQKSAPLNTLPKIPVAQQSQILDSPVSNEANGAPKKNQNTTNKTLTQKTAEPKPIAINSASQLITHKDNAKKNNSTVLIKPKATTNKQAQSEKSQTLLTKKVDKKTKTVANSSLDNNSKLPSQTPVKVRSSTTQLQSQLAQIINNEKQQGTKLAINQLEQLLTKHPNFDKARLTLIQYQWKNNSTQLASSLKQAIAISPNQNAFYSVAARYYLSKKQYQQALNFVNQHPKIESAYEILNTRALIYQRLNNHQAAIKDYQKVIPQLANKSPAFLALGISLESLGDVKNARASYQRALSFKTLNQKQTQFVLNKLNQLQG